VLAAFRLITISNEPYLLGNIGFVLQKQNHFSAANEYIIRALSYRGRVAYSQHPPIRQQTTQMDDFARCILEDRPSRVPGEMGLRDMKIIAAIFEAANSGRSVQLKV
jgi:predicted dehydrogenase